jgi:hypothetical protein
MVTTSTAPTDGIIALNARAPGPAAGVAPPPAS